MGARGQRGPRPQHDDSYRQLCGILRKLRQDCGLTQRDLAERLSRQRSFVWKTETAERRLDAVELVRWCRACEAEPLEVFKRLVAIVPAGRRPG